MRLTCLNNIRSCRRRTFKDGCNRSLSSDITARTVQRAKPIAGIKGYPPRGRTFFISQSSRGLSFWSKPNCLIASFSLQIEIIDCRLKSFLDERNILEASQSGFQAHHSWLFRGFLMTFGAEVLCPNDSHNDTSCVENLKVLFLDLFSPHTFRPWNL